MFGQDHYLHARTERSATYSPSKIHRPQCPGEECMLKNTMLHQKAVCIAVGSSFRSCLDKRSRGFARRAEFIKEQAAWLSVSSQTAYYVVAWLAYFGLLCVCRHGTQFTMHIMPAGWLAWHAHGPHATHGGMHMTGVQRGSSLNSSGHSGPGARVHQVPTLNSGCLKKKMLESHAPAPAPPPLFLPHGSLAVIRMLLMDVHHVMNQAD